MLHTHSLDRETEAYWDMLKNARDEVKLRLITLLSESIINDSKSSSHSDTKAFILKYNGVWSGDDTAEDVIARINESHNCKGPIYFD